MSAGPWPERVARWTYRTTLRAYSVAFRDEFGEDMEETFLDRWRDARRGGRWSSARYFARALADALANGVVERCEPQLGSSHVLFLQDIRYALRLLRRSPVFTLLTVVVLGGGLGLSIFTFSFLHTAMVRPIPVSGGDRIVRISQVRGPSTTGIDAADLAAMRPAITTLAAIGAYATREMIVGDEGERRVLGGAATEWNIFELTRTPAALGRGFRAGDQTPGAEPVIVLGDRSWRTAFGADSAVVNTLVTLGGVRTRVIGVMPPGYGFPVAADAWIPLSDDVVHARVAGRYSVDLYARLGPRVNAERAQRELQVLLDRALQTRADTAQRGQPRAFIEVQTFPMAQMGDEGPLVFTVLNLLASLILLLACINVTNLLLARANERARETAVRLALGASRARLVMQSMWESAILVVLSGAMATAIAAWGLAAINAWAQSHLEGNLAFWWVWRINRTTFLAAAAFVTVVIAALGSIVSGRAARTNINAVLQDGGARTMGRREGRIARVLVAAQVATVSVLMFFGVLSGVVAHRITNVDFGYATDRLLGSGVDAPKERYTTREARGAFFQSVHDGMAERTAVDGVFLRAGLADITDPESAIETGDARLVTESERPHAYIRGTLGSLATLGVTVLAGRELGASDRDGAVAVAVVSRSFAEALWRGKRAIGQRIRIGGAGEWRTVVGVVSDVLMGNPLSRARSADVVYVPLRQADASGVQLFFKRRGQEAAARAALHSALAAVDPLLEPPSISTFDEILEKSALMTRSVSRLFAFCFAFALLLAVSGTYALMARSISQRTREIGVRRALGATDRTIVQLLLGQGTRQLGIGALVALPAMLAVGVGFSHFFPIGIVLSTTTGVLVSATIMGVVLAATYLPTRRALGVEVRDALWRE